MGLKAAAEGLAAAIQADAGITAWRSTWSLAAITLIEGNREIARIRAGELPALVMEPPAEWDSAGRFPGDVRRRWQADLQAALVWHEGDEARAYDQRLALPELIVAAVAGDDTLGGAVEAAWVASGSFAQAAADPTLRIVRFATRVEFDQIY